MSGSEPKGDASEKLLLPLTTWPWHTVSWADLAEFRLPHGIKRRVSLVTTSRPFMGNISRPDNRPNGTYESQSSHPQWQCHR